MSDDPHIGRLIRRNWRVVRKIGGGGMGTVFEVKHERSHYLRRALKQIKSGLEQNSEVVRRFRREVNLMAQLEGTDHIVRVHDFDEEEGFGTFVLMDLIDGPSLADMIRQQRGRGLPYKDVLHFGRQIATALQLVHDLGVVHRDIKAPNVLVDLKKRKAYLTDFGIAKELAAAEGDQTMSDETSATVASQYIGTARYSSPEQLRVEYPPKPIWDIYSMGAVLYEAYSGLTYLPQFKTYPEFLRHIGMDEKFKLELAYPTPPPPSFAALVELCLKRDPDERMQTAAELAERLEECELELRSHPVAPAAPAAPELPKPAGAPDELRRQMRDEIEHRFAVLDEIEGTLVGAGFNLEAPPTAETLHQALRDISVIEGAGQLQEALGRLDQLREQALAAQRRAERAVRDGLEQRAAELERDIGALRQRAGQWLDGERLGAAAQGLATARRALVDSHWKQAGDELAHLSERLPQLAEAARSAAEPALKAAADAIAEQAAALQGLGARLPQGFDMAALRDQLQRAFDAGELVAAQQQAETVQSQIEAAVARAREEAGQRLRAARADCERAAAEVDPAAARALAAERLAEAESALAAARAAEASDAGAAATAYARAARAYRAASARIAEQRSAERAAAIEALRTQVGACADEPDLVVGAARRAAEALIAAPPQAHAEALAALRDAAAALTAARTQLPAFAEAERQRQAAEAVQQRTAALQQVDKDARRAAARLMAEAGRAFEERRWDDAGVRYAAAGQAWQEIERESVQRDAEQRLAHLRSEAAEALAALEQLARHAAALQVRVAAPDLAALSHDLAESVELARGGARDEAIEKLEALRGSLAETQRAYGGALGPAAEAKAAEVAKRWGELAARAGGLATQARAQEIGRLVDAIGNAAKRHEWEPALGAIDDATAWLQRAATELRRDAEQMITAQLAELQVGVEQLGKLGGTLPAGVDVEALRRDATAALDAGRFAAAADPVAAARQRLDGALAEYRHELERRAAAAREALDGQLRGLDLEAARAAAPAEVDEGTRARAAAAAAEQRQDFHAAATAYERAAKAFAAAARGLEAARREQVARLAGEVRDLDQRAARAPADLVEAARRAATQVLAGAERGAAPAAIAALEQVRDELTRALGEVEAYSAAAASRSAAEQSRNRLADLPLTAAEREESAAALRAATADFDRHVWAEAGRKFDAARARLDAIADAVTARVAEQQALERKRQEARQALRAAADEARGEEETVVGAAVEARRGEATVVGPALRAAEELLNVKDATIEALEAARTALAQAIDELPAYRAAAQARQAAETAKQRAAEKFPGKTPGRPAKLLAAAESAYGSRQWQVAAQRFADTATHYDTWKPPAVPLWAVAGGGGLIAAAAAALLLWPEAEPAPVAKPVPVTKPAARPQPTVEVVAIPPTIEAVAIPPTVEVAAIPPTVPVVEPTAVPVPVARIAAAEPEDATVTIEEGKTQPFAIQLADAGGGDPDIEWLFNGKPVSDAAGKTTWKYTADERAAGTYDVAVKVGDGLAPDRLRTWRLTVEDLNRGLEWTRVLPPTSQEIKKPIDQTVTFSVQAKDKDGDKLSYAWTVDGKPAGGDKPSLDLTISDVGTQKVMVAATDGKLPKPETREWRVTGLAKEFKPVVSPATLTSLDFKDSQTFKLDPPRGESAAGLQIAWAVNGQKVSDGQTFTFRADDEALVRPDPVRITVSARNAQNAEFTRTWPVKILPPAPTMRVAPNPGTIELEQGGRQTFSITAPEPVGAQSFKYAFTVNGRAASSGPSFELAADPGKEYTVVASLTDNFGQRAAERSWKVRAGRIEPTLARLEPTVPKPPIGDATALVEAWLDTYRSALNSKNVPQICAMLRLSADKCATLSKALSSQDELQVTFSGINITETSGGVCASYTRRDSFKDPTGKRQERSAPVKDCFTVSGGEVRKN